MLTSYYFWIGVIRGAVVVTIINYSLKYLIHHA